MWEKRKNFPLSPLVIQLRILLFVALTQSVTTQLLKHFLVLRAKNHIMNKPGFANKINVLKQFENKRIVSDQINIYVDKKAITSCAVGTYQKSVKRFVPAIQQDYTYYPVGIPYMDSAQDMLSCFLKGVLEDNYMLYMSNPIDKDKEFVVLCIACYPYENKKEKNKVISEFVTLLQEDGLLDFLNIQVVCLAKTHLEALGLLFTFSTNFILCMKHLTWGEVLWYNTGNQNLHKILEAPVTKQELFLHLMRVKKDQLCKLLS